MYNLFREAAVDELESTERYCAVRDRSREVIRLAWWGADMDFSGCNGELKYAKAVAVAVLAAKEVSRWRAGVPWT